MSLLAPLLPRRGSMRRRRGDEPLELHLERRPELDGAMAHAAFAPILRSGSLPAPSPQNHFFFFFFFFFFCLILLLLSARISPARRSLSHRWPSPELETSKKISRRRKEDEIQNSISRFPSSPRHNITVDHCCISPSHRYRIPPHPVCSVSADLYKILVVIYIFRLKKGTIEWLAIHVITCIEVHPTSYLVMLGISMNNTNIINNKLDIKLYYYMK